MDYQLRRGVRNFLYLLLVSLVIASYPASAQLDGNQGVRVTPIFSQTMPNVPGKTMTVISVEYEPGGRSVPHRHPRSGMVFAYVIAGAIRSQLDGQPANVFRAGETWSEPPNAHHVVSENASTTEPARLLAVIVADDGVEAAVDDK